LFGFLLVCWLGVLAASVLWWRAYECARRPYITYSDRGLATRRLLSKAAYGFAGGVQAAADYEGDAGAGGGHGHIDTTNILKNPLKPRPGSTYDKAINWGHSEVQQIKKQLGR
jgi:hypothetical protein